MQNDIPVRKHPRLKEYDYNQNGAYYITLCVKDRREVLSKIVGRGIPDATYIQLSEYGKNVIEAIEYINNRSRELSIDKYVVMPNHVHFIAIIKDSDGGASGKPRPTNAIIPKLVSSIKRYTNKVSGSKIWQRSYHDHIIRDDIDYLQIWQYIDENPQAWSEDCYYTV